MTQRNELGKAQREATQAIKTGQASTDQHQTEVERHNKKIGWLTAGILFLGVATIVSNFLPIYDYEVIGQAYMVRKNKITGRIKYFYIGESLLNAEDTYYEKLDEKGGEK